MTDNAMQLMRTWTRHTAYVRAALAMVANEITRRATVHDLSKLRDDEFEGFARISNVAKQYPFGSEGYAENMRKEQTTLDLHYSRNSHHSEYGGQTFLDIIEMVCDWWGAGKGYDSTMSWVESVNKNLEVKAQYLTPEQTWLAREVAQFLWEQTGRR